MLHRHEAHFFELALKDSEGSVTRAAHLLGLPGHQSLLAMLVRHKNLDKLRKPIISRRRGVRPDHDAAGRIYKKTRQKLRTVKILHVEDNVAVAVMVKETLAQEGWKVETCGDGDAAMKKIASNARYDLLLLDYELPGANGVQLVQQARSLAHRQQIPIVILSATQDEQAACLAGADAFLRKPEDIMAVGKTISRLLDQTRN